MKKKILSFAVILGLVCGIAAVASAAFSGGTGTSISAATLVVPGGETGFLAAKALAPTDLVQATTFFKSGDELKIEAMTGQSSDTIFAQGSGASGFWSGMMAKDGSAGWEHIGDTGEQIAAQSSSAEYIYKAMAAQVNYIDKVKGVLSDSPGWFPQYSHNRGRHSQNSHPGVLAIFFIQYFFSVPRRTLFLWLFNK